jgi:hypothetical protein
MPVSGFPKMNSLLRLCLAKLVRHERADSRRPTLAASTESPSDIHAPCEDAEAGLLPSRVGA